MKNIIVDLNKIKKDARVIRAKKELERAENALKEAISASYEAYLKDLSISEIFEIEEREVYAQCVVNDAKAFYKAIISLVMNEN